MSKSEDNSGLVYELGQIQKAVGRDDEKARERQGELIGALRDSGILIDDDERGSGWRLLDQDGLNLMPDRDLLFADKGYSWVYWMGLGRPHRTRMYAISDPLAEEAALKHDGVIEIDEHGELVRKPRLEVVQGGRGKDDEATDEVGADSPQEPSAEWQLEQEIEEEIEEDLAEDAALMLEAAIEKVLEHWGRDALNVICTTTEEMLEIQLLAYDILADEVVHGHEMITELRKKR